MLFYNKKLINGCSLAIWKIDESVEQLLSHFSTYKEAMTTQIASMKSEKRQKEFLSVRILISKLLGSENFKRIRVGIGKDPNIDIINYVLGKPKKEDLPKIEEALTKAMKASIDFVSLPFDKVMSMYNTKG